MHSKLPDVGGAFHGFFVPSNWSGCATHKARAAVASLPPRCGHLNAAAKLGSSAIATAELVSAKSSFVHPSARSSQR
jgi:hypothetical protein